MQKKVKETFFISRIISLRSGSFHLNAPQVSHQSVYGWSISSRSRYYQGETFSDTFIHTQLRRIFENMKAQRNLFLDHIELIFEIDRVRENLQTYIHTCQNIIYLYYLFVGRFRHSHFLSCQGFILVFWFLKGIIWN